MGTYKFTIIFILFLVFPSLPLSGNELNSKLDDNEFVTRVIYRGGSFSFCFLNSVGTGNTDIDLDFSFDSRLIRAGRLKRMGIWRELFNPLGVAAGSNLFREPSVLGKDYSWYPEGLYGVSLGKERGLNFNMIFSDSFWIGGSYTIGFGSLLLSSFVSLTEYKKTVSDDWTDDFPILPETNPAHFGIHSILKWSKYKIDYLGSLSGNIAYKAGSYNRLYIELIWKKLKIKGFGGISSPDFVSTNADLTMQKYLLSLWLAIYPYKFLETVFKSKYSEEHIPVLPVAFIPSSGSSSIKVKYDNSKFILSTELGQQFSFDSNGDEAVENKFDTKAGISGQISASVGFGVSSAFNSLTERRFEINLGWSRGGANVYFVYKYKEEIFEPVDQHTLRVRVDQEFEAGSVFFKLEIGEGWEFDGLSAGFKTIFE